MKNITLSLVIVSLMICSRSSAEEGSWKGYYNCRYTNDMAVEGDYLWCATSGGVIRWDTRESTYEIYPKTEDGRVFQSFSLFVDRKGNKWASLFSYIHFGIASYGLGRFNGESWKVYNLGYDFNYVNGIAEDNDGVMWFATYGGVLSFDGEIWKIYTIEDGLLSHYVKDVAIGKDGSKWFATSGGVSQFDGTTWTNYTEKNSGLGDNSVCKIVIDLEGVIWLSCYDSIVSFDGTTWESYPYGFNPPWWWSRSITVDDNNVKWFISYQGVMSFDGIKWTSYTAENSGLASNNVLCCKAAESKLWFVTALDGYYGISEFDGTSWKYYEPEEEQIHAPQNVRLIFVDHTNAKWFYGMYYSGFKRFDGSSWYSFSRDKYLSTDLNSMSEDKNGVMWFATNKGLVRKDDEIWTYYDNENSGLPEKSIWSVFVDHNGLLWASTSSGLCLFDGSTWTVFTTENSGLPHNSVRKIAEDRNGVMWFTYSFCVCSFDGTEWKVYNTENTEIDNFDIRDIFIDRDNVKWFATSGGITSFDDIKWENFNTENSGLVTNNVRAVLVDSKGYLWAGSGTSYEELSVFDGNTWTTYTMENSSLPATSVYDIAEDHDGVIWIGTFDGIASYDPGTSTFVAQKETQPELVSIQGAYPNPFNSSTTISFTLPATGFTQLVIYNITGQKVRQLVAETITAGIHNVMWDGRSANGLSVSSGIYISRLTIGERTASERMLLLK